MTFPKLMLGKRCPHCGSIEFRSVGVRNFFEEAMHWLMLPFRCCLCGHHFFLLRWSAPAPAPTQV